jgi:hypothetical protein
MMLPLAAHTEILGGREQLKSTVAIGTQRAGSQSYYGNGTCSTSVEACGVVTTMEHIATQRGGLWRCNDNGTYSNTTWRLVALQRQWNLQQHNVEACGVVTTMELIATQRGGLWRCNYNGTYSNTTGRRVAL